MSEVIKKASELKVGTRITFFHFHAVLAYGSHVYTYAGEADRKGFYLFDDGKKIIKTGNAKVIVE